MASQGPRVAGAVSAVNENGATDNWTSLALAQLTARDTSYATIAANAFDNNDISYALHLSNFGFTIPADAQSINGISVVVSGRGLSTGDLFSDLHTQLLIDGAHAGADRALGLGFQQAAFGDKTYGNQYDTWGLTPTAAQINATGFGVCLQFACNANNTIPEIDYVEITVHYTPLGGEAVNGQGKLSAVATPKTLSAKGVEHSAKLSAAPTGKGTGSAGTSSRMGGGKLSLVASGRKRPVRYVATAAQGGSNSNNGSLGSPWLTLTYACDHVGAGYAVYIRGGVYQERVYSYLTGTAYNPVTIASYPGETAIFDGNNYTLAAGPGDNLLEFLGSYIQVDGLEIRYSGGGALHTEGPGCVVRNCLTHHNKEHGINVGGDGTLVEGCTVHDCCENNTTGIPPWAAALCASRGQGTGERVYGCIIRNCTSYNNWGEGINTHDAVGTRVEDCVCYDNFSCQFYISDARDVTLQRCLGYKTANNVMDQSEIAAEAAQVGMQMGDETAPFGDAINGGGSSGNTVKNSLFVGNKRNLFWWQGASLGLHNATIANNTLVNADPSEGYNFQIDSGTHSGSLIQNNLVLEENAGIVSGVLFGSSSGLTFTHNIWSKTPTDIPLGNDTVADPKVTKASWDGTPGTLSGHYFRVDAETSPAIGGGLALGAVVDDYFGLARGDPPTVGGCEVGLLVRLGRAILEACGLAYALGQAETAGALGGAILSLVGAAIGLGAKGARAMADGSGAAGAQVAALKDARARAVVSAEAVTAGYGAKKLNPVLVGTRDGEHVDLTWS